MLFRKKTSYKKYVLLLIAIILAAAGYIFLSKVSNESDQLPHLSAKDVKVTLYTKPFCSYCIKAKQLLDQKNIPYNAIDLTNAPLVATKLLNLTGQTTVPYVFVAQEFIGGYDELSIYNFEKDIAKAEDIAEAVDIADADDSEKK